MICFMRLKAEIGIHLSRWEAHTVYKSKSRGL
jgi:hypothetical protein